MSYKLKDILIRYSVASVGLFLVALGVALSIISNLGTAPLSCMAYLFNLKSPGITVGVFTWLVNLCYIFIQVALLRKKFKPSYLMQIVASAVFGYMIDLSVLMLSWLHPVGFVSRLVVCVVAASVTALGVSLEVAANAWMLSAEMTVSALVQATGKPFGKLKIAMDSVIVLLSALLNLILFGNLFGSSFSSISNVLLAVDDGVVIGLGTLILAVLPGALMKLTNAPAQKLMSAIRRISGLE